MMGKFGKKHFVILIVVAIVFCLAVLIETDHKITAKELKEQYSYTDHYMVPLYNLSQEQKLIFDFAMDYSYVKNGEVWTGDLVSIHTAPSCLEASRVDCFETEEERNGKVRLMVQPQYPVLPTDRLERLFDEAYDTYDKEDEWIDAEEVVSFWGMAPIYYICIRYDMHNNKLTKLEEPMVIPFTVKSEAEVPKVTGGIDEEGNFMLFWEPVEGADGYKVYQYVTDESFDTNPDTNGAENGYKNGSLLEVGTTKETYFVSLEEDLGIGILTQNGGMWGTYFVTAVCDGKESNLSAPIHTSDFRLPYQVDEGSKVLTEYQSITELPHAVCVKNVDGTLTRHSVSYEKKEVLDDAVRYLYKVEGTRLSGITDIFNKKRNELPETIEEKIFKGSIPTTAQLNKIPSMAIKSVLSHKEGKDLKETFYEQVREKTDESIEKGNRIKTDIQNPKYDIGADSAEEAWISYHLMDRKREISLLAFPKLQDPYVLEDTLLKVCKQNPYIIGVQSYDYDYEKVELKVQYNESSYSIHKKQRFIYKEGKKLVSEIIKPSMTDLEKEEAVYNWLTEHASYDKEAYFEITKSGFREGQTINKNTNDAYGILKERRGTCGAYASTFKLLADMTGLEARTVTGYLDGNILHAWNVVKIGAGWYQVDCSNNENTIGIRYFLYNAGQKQAVKNGYTMTRESLLDNEYHLICFRNQNEDMEYYRKNNLTADNKKELAALMKQILKKESVLVFRYNDIYFSERDMVNSIKRAYMRAGKEEELAALSYRYLNGYFVIYK